MSTLVGTLIAGRFRLEERVGTGGMSTVYRALDLVLERNVAIKLMHREIAEHSDQLERFRREARAVAQLSHPHIVTVIDAGEDESRPYIVFEYVPGRTLKDRIRAGQLTVPEAVAYAIEIARALGAAHARAIVHRDVKPQNVLIDDEGSAKVTDFGIARSLHEEGLTADGRVLGTTDYVSPEQAMGQRVTGQSDIYSLGIVLWEMLVGAPPYTGENQVAVAMKHVREPLPDIQARRADVSAALAAVIDHSTAKQLNRRYVDAGDMVSDLEEVLALETARTGQATGEATSVIATLPARTRRRLPFQLRAPRWLPAALALFAVLTGVVVAIVFATRTHHGTGVPPPSHAVAQGAGPLTGVALRSNAATGYNPYGTPKDEHHDPGLAIDNDPTTLWSTQHYNNGDLAKPGVGIYIDAAPQVLARQLRVRTDTPGFVAEVYGANGDAVPQTLPDPGWVQVAPATTIGGDERIDLDTTKGPFRYYLLWITKLEPSTAPSTAADINELYLYR